MDHRLPVYSSLEAKTFLPSDQHLSNPTLPSPAPGNHHFTFCSYGFNFFFKISHTSYHAVCLSVVVFFHLVLHKITEFPSVLRLNTILHIAYFFLYSSVDGNLGWFYILVIMNIGVQISLQHTGIISFGYIPRSGIAGSCYFLIFFWGISMWFFIMITLICIP
jgi:hypothetical protein